MNTLKKVLLGAIGIIILFAVIGLFLPSQTHVERSITINAPPDKVFPLINNFREFNRWSPWAERDPNTEYRFEGPVAGVGAKMFWASENPQVGSGSNEIIESIANSRITTALDFGEMGTANAVFTLEPVEQGTQVTWGFDVEHGVNITNRYFGLMMDKWVGADYVAGLANLKTLVESLESIHTEEISYQADGVTLTGYLAYRKDIEAQPAVLVVHEWWGHNNYARKRAEMLAQLGYTAFALDMYGDGKLAEHPSDAKKFMTEVLEKSGAVAARFNAAMDILKQQPIIDSQKIAAIGYCFGGSTVLNMARSGTDLKGVVSFHGGLQGLAPLSDSVNAKMLVLNGAADPFISEEHKAAFKTEMDNAGIDYEFIDYPDVKHSFTNPEASTFGEKFDLPLEYNAEADADSWQRMKVFLAEIFK